MNESLFTHGAFDSARPLAKPDFEVMMTLASLRQVNSPTARLAMVRGERGALLDPDCTLAILAGMNSAASQHCSAIASFYDLSHLAANEGWPLLGSERAVNLGISTYVQSLALDATNPPELSGSFEDV